MAINEKRVCLTFDIEDWFQVQNFRQFFPPSEWDKQTLRVEIGTNIILELLAKYQIKATFFVLGWIANKLPLLVSRIADQGHEIASHGYNHMLNTDLTHRELRDDLQASKALLEDITGRRISGYRAPTFSITEDVLALLAELDYKYDSSLNTFSCVNSNYGTIQSARGGCEPFVHERTNIAEFPMPVLALGGCRIPIAGGGYFRLYPYPLYRELVNQYLKNNNTFVFYMHPWELDANQPEVVGLKWSYRFRQRVAINKASRKLEMFLRDNAGQSTTLSEAMQSKGDRSHPTTVTA